MPVKILILIVVCALSLQAVTVDENAKAQTLFEHSGVYIDPSAEMTLEQVKWQVFRPLGSDYLRLGYTHAAAWVRFTLVNETDRPVERDLELDNCMLDTVTLYRPGGSEETTGVLHKETIDGSRLHPYFRLRLPPHTSRTYYLRSQTDSCANYFRLTLLTPDDAWFKEMQYQLAMALFFGALLALIVYNLFIWVFTKERVYLYYVLYLLSWMETHISFSCMGQHIYKGIPWFMKIDAFLGLYYNVINIVLAFVFFKAFFRTPEHYPRINRFFNLMILYFLALSCISLIWSYRIDILDLSLLVSALILGIALLYLLFKEFDQTKYLFVGWILALVGFIALALDQLGIPNPIDQWRYFFEFSIVIEALLFSVALSARLNKNRTLEQALSTQKVLLRELHHRVKNNMQSIVSMYRLKLSGATEENLRSKMDEVERTVQAMGRIHEMLYSQKEIDDVDARSYLGILVEQLQRSAPPDVRIGLDTAVHLQTDQAIHCAVIVNELVTNALKHAFGPEGGRVDIRLHANAGGYALAVCDDGKGIAEGAPKGFGLELVRGFAAELGGTVSINGERGSCIRIRF